LGEHSRESQDSILSCIFRAAGHGVEALRCYAALIGREFAGAAYRLVRRLVLLAILLALALVALVMLLWGLGTLLSDWLGVAGLGHAVVGFVTLIVVGVLLALAGHAGDDSDESGRE